MDTTECIDGVPVDHQGHRASLGWSEKGGEQRYVRESNPLVCCLPNKDISSKSTELYKLLSVFTDLTHS